MESTHAPSRVDFDLPPGFRFHPTDEELITHYLIKKVVDGGFTSRAIAEIDLNKCEPWDLPWRAKMGEKEWYFFCVKDRKYPTGLRTNRATEAGYWKATGKDKEIHLGKTRQIIGMKKTLVFYLGRAPRGEKTDWIMHEYRLEGPHSPPNYTLHRTLLKNEWVICRVFKKNNPMAVGPSSGQATNLAEAEFAVWRRDYYCLSSCMGHGCFSGGPEPLSGASHACHMRTPLGQAPAERVADGVGSAAEDLNQILRSGPQLLWDPDSFEYSFLGDLNPSSSKHGD